MNYRSLVQKLFQVNLVSGLKSGLNNALRMQFLLDYPDRTFKIVHVAGTNGKGSVSTKIARGLELNGQRVGLYTSPHISSFRERIKINGVMISEEDTALILTSLFELVKLHQIPATFFELTTFLAFLYFAHEKVDVAVLETGLGGRYDATNVVLPCLSVITSISLDHVDLLGSSLQDIAREKGGIIKENVPVVIGPHVPLTVIAPIAFSKGSRCIQVRQTSLLYEEENRAIAQAALQQLSPIFSFSSDQIVQGLKAKQPCRFECLSSDPRVILDVAHNPDGIRHLILMLDHYYPNKKVCFVFGLSKTKDAKACITLLASKGAHFHLVEVPNGRGIYLPVLKEELLRCKIDSSKIHLHSDIKEGIAVAKRRAQQQAEIVVVCGSFYIMSGVRQALGIIESYEE